MCGIVSRLALSAITLLVGPSLGIAAPMPAKAAKNEATTTAARRALEHVGDFQYQTRSLIDVVDDIKHQTGVEITLDPTIVNFGLDPSSPTINANLKRTTVREALKAILAPHNLRVGVTRQGLYISHDEGVTAYQLRQSVSIDCDGTPFNKAVNALTMETGANVVVDPRFKEQAETPIVLKLEEVPLETALRLLAELADLRAVRMSNVMFITSRDRAQTLRQDADGPLPPSPPTPVIQQLNLNGGNPFIGFGGPGGVAPALPIVAPPAVRAAPAAPDTPVTASEPAAKPVLKPNPMPQPEK